MITGKWLQPRHPSADIFEKDFPALDINGVDAHCPGCNGYIKLSRKNPAGKVAGWCKKCNRGVTP